MKEAASRPDPDPAPIGPGRLVLVVGPSGAGKDTILRAARTAFAADDSVIFPRRTVTRPDNDDEAHDSVDAALFAAASQQGLFALTWQAHGLAYGLPATIDADIGVGRTVVCNASRGIVATARRRYRHVVSVLVTASPSILAARLAARSRASDASLAARLERNKVYAAFSPDAVIVNDGSVEDAVKLFVAIVRRASVR